MRFHRLVGTAAVVAVCATAGVVLPAVADANAAPARIAKSVKVGTMRTDIVVASPTMGKRVSVSVLTPRIDRGPRPTVYLLDGNDAAGGVSDWMSKGGIRSFFADKNVNVVVPRDAAGTFYTNWRKHDPKIGKPQWETFLTTELPPLINKQFNGTGRAALIGVSMGGQGAFALLSRHPNLFTGAASISGCPPVSGPLNQAYVRTTVAKSGGNADNMWGPPGSKLWVAHDPLTHLNALRGKNLFLSAGSGAIGPPDLLPQPKSDLPEDAVTASASALELGAYRCSLEFALQLRQAGIAYNDGFRIIGTHRWEYFRGDLPAAWATVSRGLW